MIQEVRGSRSFPVGAKPFLNFSHQQFNKRCLMYHHSLRSLALIGPLCLLSAVSLAGQPGGSLRKGPPGARPPLPHLALPTQAAPNSLERSAAGLKRAQDGINRAATGFSRAAPGLERATSRMQHSLPPQASLRAVAKPRGSKPAFGVTPRSLPATSAGTVRPLAAEHQASKVVPAGGRPDEPSQVLPVSGNEPRAQSRGRIPSQLPSQAAKPTSWLDRFHLSWPFSSAQD